MVHTGKARRIQKANRRLRAASRVHGAEPTGDDIPALVRTLRDPTAPLLHLAAGPRSTRPVPSDPLETARQLVGQPAGAVVTVDGYLGILTIRAPDFDLEFAGTPTAPAAPAA